MRLASLSLISYTRVKLLHRCKNLSAKCAMRSYPGRTLPWARTAGKDLTVRLALDPLDATPFLIGRRARTRTATEPTVGSAE
ncbi:hypothetical protein GCM10009579_37040 [Streptomyces javensis]|uniref:Uncharacterized protein n=1 Tax=Streptomyces javensis TaxID=114698 RepID=A0ABP4HMU9_9ACTN